MATLWWQEINGRLVVNRSISFYSQLLTSSKEMVTSWTKKTGGNCKMMESLLGSLKKKSHVQLVKIIISNLILSFT